MQVDHGFEGRLQAGAAGGDEGQVVDVQMSHHHELHKNLPQGLISDFLPEFKVRRF